MNVEEFIYSSWDRDDIWLCSAWVILALPVLNFVELLLFLRAMTLRLLSGAHLLVCVGCIVTPVIGCLCISRLVTPTSVEIGMDRKHFTVTLLKYNVRDCDVFKKTLQECGDIVEFREYNDRYFIRFLTEEEALKVIDKYGTKYGITMARSNTKDPRKKPYIGSGNHQQSPHLKKGSPEKLENKENLNGCSIEVAQYRKNVTRYSSGESLNSDKSRYSRNSDGDKHGRRIIPEGQNGPLPSDHGHLNKKKNESRKSDFNDITQIKDSAEPPPLLDAKKIPKLYCLVVANLPNQYTLEDVYNLVEEVQPAAFTEIDVTEREKVKFCQVYVRNPENITYLTGKLNGFVICGKKLIVAESSKILSQARWNF